LQGLYFYEDVITSKADMGVDTKISEDVKKSTTKEKEEKQKEVKPPTKVFSQRIYRFRDILSSRQTFLASRQ
jgi:hypothetical protein